MTELQVYMWLMLDGVNIVLGALSLIFFIVSIISWITLFTEYQQSFLPRIIVTLITLTVLSLVVFIPTKRQYAMIKVIPKMVNSELMQEVKDDIPELYTMAKEGFKELIKGEER